MQDTLAQLAAWWPDVLLLAIWVLIFLCAVNWAKMGPVLRQGGWAPALLLLAMAALVWSRLAPSQRILFGFAVVPNFWWQLGGIALLACLALFCGWLQTYLGFRVPEISTEPAAPASHDHGHH